MATSSIPVWKNSFRNGESKPDFTAENVEINGVECDVAVWMAKTKTGDDYLSLRIGPPYKTKEERAAAKEAYKRERQVDGPSTDTQPDTNKGQDEDDLPF